MEFEKQQLEVCRLALETFPDDADMKIAVKKNLKRLLAKKHPFPMLSCITTGDVMRKVYCDALVVKHAMYCGRYVANQYRKTFKTEPLVTKTVKVYPIEHEAHIRKWCVHYMENRI